MVSDDGHLNEVYNLDGHLFQSGKGVDVDELERQQGIAENSRALRVQGVVG
jgi:hypothetical protein